MPALVARVEASKRRGELSALYLFEAVVTALIARSCCGTSRSPAILLLVALDGTAALAAQRAAARRGRPRGARGALASSTTAPPRRSRARPLARRAASSSRASRRPSAGRTRRSTSPSRSRSSLGPALGGVARRRGGGTRRADRRRRLLRWSAARCCSTCARTSTTPAATRSRAPASGLASHQRGARAARPAAGGGARARSSSSPARRSRSPSRRPRCTRAPRLRPAAHRVGGRRGARQHRVRALVRRPLGTMLSAGTLAVGLGYIGFAIAPTLATACVAALVGGIGNGMQWPSLISVVQRLTPQRSARAADGRRRIARRALAGVRLPLGGALVAIELARAPPSSSSASEPSRRAALSCRDRDAWTRGPTRTTRPAPRGAGAAPGVAREPAPARRRARARPPAPPGELARPGARSRGRRTGRRLRGARPLRAGDRADRPAHGLAP